MIKPAAHNSRKQLLIAAAWMILALPRLPAQASSAKGESAPQGHDAMAQLPVFEVASVKPNKSGDSGTRIMFTPDGVSYQGFSLQMLLRETFAMEDDRILGVPGWAGKDRYDIEAKVESADVPKLKDLTLNQRRQMLVPVLEDRFNLKFHHESRELPTYALVIARSGLKLTEAKPGDTYPNGLKDPEGHGRQGMMWAKHGEIRGQGVAIEELVNMLGYQRLGRTIFDKTGLTGKYDFTLKWTPDDGPPAMAPGADGGPPRNDAADSDSGGPSIFAALEEQLGLKLELQKAPVDVIVIDRVERPSEN